MPLLRLVGNDRIIPRCQRPYKDGCLSAIVVPCLFLLSAMSTLPFQVEELIATLNSTNIGTEALELAKLQVCVYVARDSAATWSVPHVIVSSRPFFPRRHSCSRPCRCTLKELRFPPLRCSPHIITALVSQRIHRPHEHTSMRATEGVDGGAAALRVLRVHDSGAGSSSGRRTRIIIGVKAKPLLDVARWIRT